MINSQSKYRTDVWFGPLSEPKQRYLSNLLNRINATFYTEAFHSSLAVDHFIEQCITKKALIFIVMQNSNNSPQGIYKFIVCGNRRLELFDCCRNQQNPDKGFMSQSLANALNYLKKRMGHQIPLVVLGVRHVNQHYQKAIRLYKRVGFVPSTLNLESAFSLFGVTTLQYSLRD